MIHLKQTERMISKISRLTSVYEKYLVEERIPLVVKTADGHTMSDGEAWGTPFSCTDFYAELPDLGAEKIYLECDDGAVENLIEIDGVPCGMTDWVRNATDAIFRVHRYVLLENVRAGAKLRVQGYASHPIAGTQPYDTSTTFSLRSLEGERVFRAISLVRMNEPLKAFMENLELLNGLFTIALEGGEVKFSAYRLYETLFRILPLAPETKPGAECLSEANAQIEKFFANLPKAEVAPTVGLIGHSHLDTAWLWPVAETKRKALRTAANAVTLLKRYPDYKFIMSSALHLDWIKQESPALFAEISELVKEGRFEPNGATWVECDCNLTGAEAMARQFVRGKRFLREELGYEADTFWLPDTFGYSAALPQILQLANVKYFLTTKLSWNDTNAFPYDTFRWQGIDGSSVLVHFNTIQSDGGPVFLADRLQKRKLKHLTDSALAAYGYGDGGGGPSDDMVHAALRTQEIFPWAKVKHVTVSEFMQGLEGKELPKYCGELYLELHRGTLSVHHDLKRNNRLLEGALHNAEYLSVAASRPEWKEVTDACYDTLMLNQFHDILPGSAIGEVNALARAENAEAVSRLNKLISEGKGKHAYYNTLGFAREETLACAPAECDYSYTDLNGVSRSVARYSFSPFGKGKRVKPRGGVTLEEGVVRTPFYTAKIEHGFVKSLIFDGREVAAGNLNTLKFCECVPRMWDNWDIDADYPLKEREVEFVSSEIVLNTSDEVRVRSKFAFGASKLTTDTVFRASEPGIRFENKLEFAEKHGMLRAYFPTNLVTSAVKSQIQFGYIERSVYRNTSEDQARFETCNHKWSDLSETNFGVALLNDCKYGFSCEEGTLSLTLAKSGTHPDPAGDVGTMYFTYVLLPHKGGFSAERVVQPAESLNVPPVFTPLVPVSPLKMISAPNILCETVKIAEDGEGAILRLYECERSRTETELHFDRAYRISECNLLEDELASLGETDCLRLTFRPFEIKTIRIK